MGLFDMFKSSREVAKEEIWEVPWIRLENMGQLQTLTEESQAVPVVIFKHSTTCGISKMSLRGFEKGYSFEEKQVKPYFLDLKQYREISNAISERFQVMHESPQLLLIKNGTVVYHTSHGDISAEALSEHL
ncbi:MAG: bacillithiol system redox-active protein YtxJ [Leeuwenhoekiella sp.]